MQATPRALAKGILSYIPGANFILIRSRLARSRVGGADSARYCYSVWLRHMAMAHEHGLSTDPRVVAELGPGASLGIGLAALISGVDRYYALDVVRHATSSLNLEVFDRLVELFRARQVIPGEDEFPEVKPKLDSYNFPKRVFTPERLEIALETKRLAGIRKSIVSPDSEGSRIRYQVPWYNTDVIEYGSVDLIFSQAVLEHVDELPLTYERMHKWLKASGVMSHTIDFRCHRTARDWNGHWTYSDLMWKLIRGRLPYLINRAPYSRHVELMNSSGFKIVNERKTLLPSRIDDRQLAPGFPGGTDLTTSGVFVQALKYGAYPHRQGGCAADSGESGGPTARKREDSDSPASLRDRAPGCPLSRTRRGTPCPTEG